MTRPLVAIAFSLALGTAASRILAVDSESLMLKWLGACSQIEGYVNAIADSNTTKCVPAGQGIGQGTFMLISALPVFSTPKAKKAWAIIAVGAAGKVANDFKSLDCRNVTLSDVESMKKGRGYVLPCTTAKAVQKGIHDGTLTVDQGWSRIESSLKLIEVPVGERSK